MILYDRRRLLNLMGTSGAGLLAGGPIAALAAETAWPRNIDTVPRFADHPFSLGVASGDPAPDGFVIWTRLAPVRSNPMAAWRCAR
jgi:alkaline phosphatase D